MKLTTFFTSICVWKQGLYVVANRIKNYDVIFEEMSNQMPTTSDVANFIIDPIFLKCHVQVIVQEHMIQLLQWYQPFEI